MIKREIKEVVICDFCGREFTPSDDYPRAKNGEYIKFNLSLTFGVSHYGEDSPSMGCCSGHICGDCLRDISDKISHCKRQVIVGDILS